MNVLALVRERLPLRALVAVGVGCGVAAAVVIARSIDAGALARAARQATAEPAGVALAVVAFGAAFALRAAAWQRVLPGLSASHALAGIHLSLGANHVLPFRLGEPVRIVSVVRRQGIGVEAATASTLTLRAVDVLAVVALGLAVGPAAVLDLVGWASWAVFALVAGLAVVGWRWLRVVVDRGDRVALPDAAAVALSVGAWLAEAVLVHQAAGWAGVDLGWSEAVLVATVAVAAQVAAVAPGGLGTYEAAAVGAYVALGHDADAGLVAAVAAHAVKTAYSLGAGAVALFLPAPSVLGRLRLAPGRAGPPARPRRAAMSPVAPDAPIVLVMPAHDEAATVAACARRAPARVDGHPVQVVVIDDGSVDATATEARRAGAEVVRFDRNRGLGAAVRHGLALGVERCAAAVVFCDADGEYPPEELPALVRPILAGDADYVTGSRFLGRIDHMQVRRRLGNRVLTRLLAVIARQPITDGQTGYRALSGDAAAAAEVIHDFNYAQVLTLDLLAKGFRYLEVPISYRFRTTGESFVKLGSYLHHVVPAVYRELNAR